MDLSKFSTEDLQAMMSGDVSKISTDGLKLLDQGYAEAQDQASEGIGTKAWNTVKGAVDTAGKVYEKYLTAPTRAAVMEEAQHGFGGKPLSAFAHQFGEDPSQAPSGQDIARQLGVPSTPIADTPKPVLDAAAQAARFDPYSAQAAGFMNAATVPADQAAGVAINAAADPLLVAPLGTVAGVGGKVIRGTVGLGVDATGALVKGIAGTSDVLTGTKLAGKMVKGAETVIDTAGNIAEASNAALKKVFSPKVAEDFPQMAAVAQKNGIDPTLLPESVEFGRGSFLDTASRARREGPIGEVYMEKFQQGLNQVKGAVDAKIAQIGGGQAPLAAPAAGVELRKGFDQAVGDFWKSIELTHDTVVSKYAPGLYIDGAEMDKLSSTLNGIEKFAKGRVDRGITAEARSQGQELLNAVQAFRSGNGSYKQTVEAMREIGDAAFSTQHYPGKIPSDTEKLRKLYFSIDDALINTVDKHVSPEMAAELKANNGAIHDLFEKQNQIGHVLSDRNIAPEDAFKRIVMNGDTDQLAALQKMLPPETLQQMKGAFLEGLVKRDPDGSLNMTHLFSAMRNKQTQIKMLFSPQEITDMGELLQLGDRFGKAVLSTSGTGSSNVMHHLFDSFKSSVANDTLIENLKTKARTPALPAPPSGGRSPLWYITKGSQTLDAGGASRGPSSEDNAMQRRLQRGR